MILVYLMLIWGSVSIVSIFANKGNLCKDAIWALFWMGTIIICVGSILQYNYSELNAPRELTQCLEKLNRSYDN